MAGESYSPANLPFNQVRRLLTVSRIDLWTTLAWLVDRLLLLASDGDDKGQRLRTL